MGKLRVITGRFAHEANIWRYSVRDNACNSHQHYDYNDDGFERSHELTSQISDPAPVAHDLKLMHHRRVRCIWLVRLASTKPSNSLISSEYGRIPSHSERAWVNWATA